MDVLLLVNFFRYYLSLKLTFRHNSARKIHYIWNDIVSRREIDQTFSFGGLIGYENSYLYSILCYSKIFTLQATLHGAAGAVRSHTGKGPAYCYMIGQSPKFCLLGHVTGLLLCLYV